MRSESVDSAWTTCSIEGVGNVYGGSTFCANSMTSGAATISPQRTPASDTNFDSVRSSTTCS